MFNNTQGLLPSQSEGYYKEFDVNPLQQGVSRGTERFVTGKGGEVYYTDTHYGSVKSGPAFQKIK